MSVGIPIVASEDAVAGMDISPDAIALAKNERQMAELTLKLLDNSDQMMIFSKAARQEVEKKFSFETTYYDYFSHLSEYILLGK